LSISSCKSRDSGVVDALNLIAAIPIVDRTDDARLDAGGSKHRFDQIGDGRLAVGAGNAY
jgi:hypothetical protein